MPKIWNDLLNLFFPNLCRVCRKPLIEQEKQICLHCLCDLPRTSYHRSEKENPAEQLFAGNIQITQAYSFLFFEKGGHVQQLIHSLKYHGNKEIGYILGRQAAVELTHAASPLCQVDVLIPVPLHPRKQRQRGYNQSEWIAKGISAVWNTPIDTSSLRKSRPSETQTHKSVYHRWVNVEGIFTCAETDKLAGKHILLIDDVITTGSTISECANVLSVIPGIQISLFSLSIA